MVGEIREHLDAANPVPGFLSAQTRPTWVGYRVTWRPHHWMDAK
jgi:hypothetical protein